MNRYLSILAVGISSLLILSSCSGSTNDPKKLSWNTKNQNISQIGGEFKKAIDNPATKEIAERVYSEYTAGAISEGFMLSALMYLNNEKPFPDFVKRYKSNMWAFSEKPTDRGGDYIGGYIFSYARVPTSDCIDFVTGFSGTLAGKRLLTGCLDVTLVYNTLEKKDISKVTEAKKNGWVTINESLLTAIAKGDSTNCGICGIIVSGSGRDEMFNSLDSVMDKFGKGRELGKNMKTMNVYPLFQTLDANMGLKDRFDLAYDHYYLMHAIYKGDASLCSNLSKDILVNTCKGYISRNKNQEKEYAGYIEPYIVYSYLYGL